MYMLHTIFTVAVCVGLPSTNAYKWSMSQQNTAGDSDVSVKNNPAGVNLGAAMLAVSQTSLDFFGTNRTSSLDIDKKATVTVLQPDLQSSLDVEVSFEDADRGYCNPDRGAWPGVFATAMKKAGWNLSKSIPVPSALQAVTGLEPATFFYRENDTTVTNVTFKDTVLKPIRFSESPLVIQTRDKSFHDLKANYAYALYVPQPIFKYADENEVILTDPEAHQQRTLNASDVFDATEYLFGTKTGLKG